MHEVVKQGGDEVERGDPLRLDQRERGLGAPLGLADEAAVDGGHARQRVDAHRVVERHDAERALAPLIAALDHVGEGAGVVVPVRRARPSAVPSSPRCRGSARDRPPQAPRPAPCSATRRPRRGTRRRPADRRRRTPGAPPSRGRPRSSRHSSRPRRARSWRRNLPGRSASRRPPS